MPQLSVARVRTKPTFIRNILFCKDHKDQNSKKLQILKWCFETWCSKTGSLCDPLTKKLGEPCSKTTQQTRTNTSAGTVERNEPEHGIIVLQWSYFHFKRLIWLLCAINLCNGAGSLWVAPRPGFNKQVGLLGCHKQASQLSRPTANGLNNTPVSWPKQHKALQQNYAMNVLWNIGQVQHRSSIYRLVGSTGLSLFCFVAQQALIHSNLPAFNTRQHLLNPSEETHFILGNPRTPAP